MDQQYLNIAWIPLERGVFDRLYQYRRRVGVSSWEQTIERLLASEPIEAPNGKTDLPA